jgi:hypothetical protein
MEARCWLGCCRGVGCERSAAPGRCRPRYAGRPIVAVGVPVGLGGRWGACWRTRRRESCRVGRSCGRGTGRRLSRRWRIHWRERWRVGRARCGRPGRSCCGHCYRRRCERRCLRTIIAHAPATAAAANAVTVTYPRRGAASVSVNSEQPILRPPKRSPVPVPPAAAGSRGHIAADLPTDLTTVGSPVPDKAANLALTKSTGGNKRQLRSCSLTEGHVLRMWAVKRALRRAGGGKPKRVRNQGKGAPHERNSDATIIAA